MKRFAIIALLILGLGGYAAAGDLLPGPPNQVPDHYIVVLHPGAAPGAVAGAHGLARTHTYSRALNGFSATIPAAALSKLLKDPAVDYVEPDARVSAMPKPPWAGGGGGSEEPAGQTTPWGVTRVGGPANGTGKVAWVIDTGVDLDNPDLNVDVTRSRNFVSRGRNSADDGNGHGTHVAGTIGAIDNSIGVVGVAAGATIVSVRVLDNGGSGYLSEVVAGVDYVAANGAAGDAANMSLGAAGHSQALHDAVVNAASVGVNFAIAAGNDGADASDFEPAHVDHPHVYTISAIGQDDCLTSWSNWGDPVDFAAPGAGILSTKKGGGTTTMSGTSMATPHVTGLLLLGPVQSDGTACGDPDASPDPIAHN